MKQVRIALLALAAALVAAGCGDSTSTDGDGDGRTKDTPTKPRAVDQPTADEDLTDALEDDAKVLRDAGCTFGTYDVGDVEHVDEGDDLESESFPPTGGKHYGSWAPFGLYDEPIEDGFVVHNLEHGGVVAWLGTKVDDATRDAIADLLDQDEKWVVAPRRDIEGLFSGAWGVGLSCPPAALEKLGPDQVAESLDAWYDVVESTGSDAEKDVPAYAGGMKEPTPEQDISTEAQF